eukprot:TRINITY_DN10739_c0_g1_i2.p2 TRINITY_DN10739_c0_g1~~TRINITY_DN10739_c0_g1_i2.p2  ORF type:complete len:126 (+),score=32.27 TRINITY_DN10739_c0_g1_i2:34-378(+)
MSALQFLSHKSYHPNTLRNRDIVWQAEQEAARALRDHQDHMRRIQQERDAMMPFVPSGITATNSSSTSSSSSSCALDYNTYRRLYGAAQAVPQISTTTQVTAESLNSSCFSECG